MLLLLFFIVIIVVISGAIILKIKNEYETIYERQNRIIEKLRKAKENLFNEYLNEITKRVEPQQNMTINNDDIIDAIKYARKSAHPDNGGSQEDFIHFNNLYKKVIGEQNEIKRYS